MPSTKPQQIYGTAQKLEALAAFHAFALHLQQQLAPFKIQVSKNKEKTLFDREYYLLITEVWRRYHLDISLCIADAAEVMFEDEQTARKKIRELHKLGLLQIDSHPDDKRKKTIKPTQKLNLLCGDLFECGINLLRVAETRLGYSGSKHRMDRKVVEELHQSLSLIAKGYVETDLTFTDKD